MASFLDKRLACLHEQFLSGSAKYPSLFFAAAKPIKVPGDLLIDKQWLLIPRPGGGCVRGIPAYEWKSLLGKLLSELLIPLSTRILAIDGSLWEGAYFDDANHFSMSQDQLNTRINYLMEGISEFERIAALAVENIPSAQSIHPELDEPEPKIANRWLEYTSGFVKPVEREAFLLRLVSGDIFTASALAIETLGNGQKPLLTEPMTKIELGKWFNCHRNQVDDDVLGKYPHEKVGAKFQLHVKDMPVTYHISKQVQTNPK